MYRYPRWPIHAILAVVSFLMLIPFYWVLKTSFSGENIFAYPPSILPKSPHPFYYVDVWYYIPFARYFANSVIVSLIAVIANVAFNAMAGYAPTREFPADGAAGEGFTNAAEALTDISPALFTRYLDAAKDIAEHAVLLPDGFRFSPSKTRRDWTDENL